MTEREWALLAEFFPPRRWGRGGRWRDDPMMANGNFWRLNTGTAWRDLPDRYGPWQTVYHRFNALRRAGVIDRMVAKHQLLLNDAGLIDPTLFGIDGTNVRAARAAAGAANKKLSPGDQVDHALGRSQHGFGTKLHLVCDRNRVSLAVVVTPGQRQECMQFEAVLDAVRIPARRGRPRRRPKALAGDKVYSYPGIRTWLRWHGVKAVIPRRKDRRPDDRRHRFDSALYRERAGVEQCVGWLKECRAVGTRFDKLAVNSRATVQLAMIRSCLRVLVRAEVNPSDRA